MCVICCREVSIPELNSNTGRGTLAIFFLSPIFGLILHRGESTINSSRKAFQLTESRKKDTLKVHVEDFIVNIAVEFCNREIDRYSAIIYYPFTSYMYYLCFRN